MSPSPNTGWIKHPHHCPLSSLHSFQFMLTCTVLTMASLLFPKVRDLVKAMEQEMMVRVFDYNYLGGLHPSSY